MGFFNFGGGGSSVVQTATKTLTDAQIKALPTTPIELVAAPGSGKVIWWSMIVLRATIAGSYTNIGDRCSLGVESTPSILIANDAGGSGGNQINALLANGDGT